MSVKRYDLIERTCGMQVWHEMTHRPDGDYVPYEDYVDLLQITERYRQHDSDCCVRRYVGKKKVCTCGLDLAMSSVRGGK